MEIRVQGDQVDREDHAGGGAAADHLEHVAPNEYGFYANVNPQVDHPRWSQATERRSATPARHTLMFNGYAEQVGRLYAGMDLRKNF